MTTLALENSGRVEFVRTLSGIPAVFAMPMSTGTCHWYKRIKGLAGHPPGVLFMV